MWKYVEVVPTGELVRAGFAPDSPPTFNHTPRWLPFLLLNILPFMILPFQLAFIREIRGQPLRCLFSVLQSSFYIQEGWIVEIPLDIRNH